MLHWSLDKKSLAQFHRQVAWLHLLSPSSAANSSRFSALSTQSIALVEESSSMRWWLTLSMRELEATLSRRQRRLMTQRFLSELPLW